MFATQGLNSPLSRMDTMIDDFQSDKFGPARIKSSVNRKTLVSYLNRASRMKMNESEKFQMKKEINKY